MPQQNKFKAIIAKPPFPETGSVIGSDGKYFCLGRLGAGTFCEIFKCIDLSYSHSRQVVRVQSGDGNNTTTSSSNPQRLVAAKVELSDFQKSGVLDAEVMILKHLSAYMPQNMIPTFVEYIQSKEGDKDVHVIIMEYLNGEDMNRMRDRNAQFVASKRNDLQNLHIYRRISVADSVYLCRNVFLPLLKSMHDCGTIHRDVKPSNCVRTGPGEEDKAFKLVDFGLSKSFVVPRDSSYADTERVWEGPWDAPPNLIDSSSDKNQEGAVIGNDSSDGSDGKIVGCIRKERDDAEFRGTSMYASLRVHQRKDYGRRDDIWGLMYVFCDLVSGGLPWMGYAANRERAVCQLIKEYVHGERESMNLDDITNVDERTASSTGLKVCQDRVEDLLMGADYHLCKHRRDSIVMMAKKRGEDTPSEENLPKLPKALAMAKDEIKCNALREVFDHLSKLSFADRPDYDLVERCLDKFLTNDSSSSSSTTLGGDGVPVGEFDPPPIRWKQPAPKLKMKKEKKSSKESQFKQTLLFMDENDIDPLNENIFLEAEAIMEKDNLAKDANGMSMVGDTSDLSRLPLQLQFQLAQVEYNAAHPNTIPIHLAFRDWMNLATSLVYDKWDTAKYEKGNHRSNDDGYRRELYLQLLHQCLEAAKQFGNFSSKDCFYFNSNEGDDGYDDDDDDDLFERKRRKIVLEETRESRGDGSAKSTLLALSKVMCALRSLLENERERIFAPPPSLSFGVGIM